MEILKVQDLCKTYGIGEAKVDALKKVSFSLSKGEFAAVVGESGSGKSTLLNCVGALDSPTSGHIWVDGQDLFSMKYGFQPQPLKKSSISSCGIREKMVGLLILYPFK